MVALARQLAGDLSRSLGVNKVRALHIATFDIAPTETLALLRGLRLELEGEPDLAEGLAIADLLITRRSSRGGCRLAGSGQSKVGVKFVEATPLTRRVAPPIGCGRDGRCPSTAQAYPTPVDSRPNSNEMCPLAFHPSGALPALRPLT